MTGITAATSVRAESYRSSDYKVRTVMVLMKKRRRLERFTEFLLVGVVLGVVEDMIAVMLVTGESFSPEMLGVVVMVTVPFAAFSELVVDSDEYLIIEKMVEKMKGFVP